MNDLNKIALAVTIMAGGIAASAQAQTTEFNPAWYISPSVNISQPDTQMGTDKNTNGVGLRVGKPISQNWDVQMGITGTRTSDNLPRFRQTTLGVDGLYMLSRSTIRPFLLVGTGVQYDELERTTGNTSQTSPYLSLGVGVQAALNDQWAVQVDYRRNHGFREGNNLGADSSNSNYLTLSLNYAFDKPARERSVVAAAPVMAVAPAPYIAPPVPPAPVAVPAPAPRFERYTLSATELFGFDSAQLKMPQPKLDEIAAALTANREVSNVVITGYTDRLGSEKYNHALSERRAIAVKDYLTAKGLDATRLNTVGKGEANPVVICTEKKMAQLIECLEPNRRVEVEQITVQRRVQ